MTAFVDHPNIAADLDTDGMTDFERQAAHDYARMIGLDQPRDLRLAELRRLSTDAPVRKVHPLLG